MIFLIVGLLLGSSVTTLYYEQEPKRMFMRDGKVYQVNEVLIKDQVEVDVKLLDSSEVKQ